jgi:hypothetical protein
LNLAVYHQNKIINGFRFNKEIKMKNKRTMIISTLAVLVVILGVAAFLAYTRSTGNAQPIPVTGRSNSGVEYAEQIQAQQGLQSLKDQPAPAVDINGAIKADPSWDHISGQSALPGNSVDPVDMDLSWDHISGY